MVGTLARHLARTNGTLGGVLFAVITHWLRIILVFQRNCQHSLPSIYLCCRKNKRRHSFGPAEGQHILFFAPLPLLRASHSSQYVKHVLSIVSVPSWVLIHSHCNKKSFAIEFLGSWSKQTRIFSFRFWDQRRSWVPNRAPGCWYWSKPPCVLIKPLINKPSSPQIMKFVFHKS